jgi:hypothetical protein
MADEVRVADAEADGRPARRSTSRAVVPAGVLAFGLTLPSPAS